MSAGQETRFQLSFGPKNTSSALWRFRHHFYEGFPSPSGGGQQLGAKLGDGGLQRLQYLKHNTTTNLSKEGTVV
ncbi:MAG TPA: hypothetical protein VEV15_10830 [Flavisolibacter sp.]|nr:hypothetical protein [Flavisolibacter sp.]